MEAEADFGFLMRRPAIGQNETNQVEGNEQEEKKDDKNVKSHFPLLFNREGTEGGKKKGVIKAGPPGRNKINMADVKQSQKKKAE